MYRGRTGGKAETEMNQTVGERIIKRAVEGWGGGGGGGRISLL